MKKITVICAALVTLAVFAGCASKPKTTTTTTTTTVTTTTTSPATSNERKVSGNVPQFVKDAMKKAPEDALVGIGTARMASLSQSRTMATTRARAEISRQLNTVMSDMITDFTAGSEVDHSAVLSYSENITTALSRSTLTGSVPVEEDMDDNGNYWVVVMLSKTNAVNEINQAQAAAKLAVPAMAAFNAQDRMNAAFDKLYGAEIGVVDR